MFWRKMNKEEQEKRLADIEKDMREALTEQEVAGRRFTSSHDKLTALLKDLKKENNDGGS